MKLHIHESQATILKNEHFDYIQLLDDSYGAVANCVAGVLSYTQEEFIQGGIHEDQEGFYVLEGTGLALVGDMEFPLSPGSCFMVPAGYYHAIKKDKDVPHIKLFFFHAAI